MQLFKGRKAGIAAGILLAIGMGFASAAVLPDHQEFEATLDVPFTHSGKDAREFVLSFDYPGAQKGYAIAWRLELISPQNQVVQTWNGEQQLFGKELKVKVPWQGRSSKSKWQDGLYTVRLTATSGDPKVLNTGGFGSKEWRVTEALANTSEEIIEQEWQIKVGEPLKPVMPEFRALPVGLTNEKSAPAGASLPYTVYFGNFHAQTNDSDGGGAVATCSSSQAAQSGAFGPADAYPYAKARGLDFLLNSEHNHYFDGSSNTNTSAVPSVGINRYQAGRTTANNYSAANPGFLAMYGMEWGVINNGGHMNILNGNLLAAWEFNASNQLIGEVLTPKSDYAGIYATMAANNWIGQFNHPASSGQFIIGTTPLAYNANGENVMVLAEVMNTSAFSSNTTETETGRSTYEGAFNTLLERGYRVAPATNQDNHCANWGASYTNRTGVLIPTGTAISASSMDAALRARRAFATMDKNSQIILTANGRVMGEKFTNSGVLNLTVNFANSAGRSVQSVTILRGVPKRNGAVTTLASTATASLTPTVGEHFFYAKITQDDGKILWSAPIWVTQTAGSGDTTPPSVSASESGTSGAISLNANATDNVGVTQVEFYIDGTLRGSDTSSPYSLSFNSATLANGSHNLTAKAFDAAGNSTTSSAVSFSINNATADTTPPTVTASETGSSGTITLSATASDNVGVSNVEFYIDGVLRGSDASSPYSIGFNSTSLSNASHALTAKAFDAAGNNTTSSAINFSINNVAAPVERIVNGGYESGSSSWTVTSGVIDNSTSQPSFAGSWKAWMNGYGATHTDTMYQSITIPSTVTSANLSFYLDVVTAETTTTSAFDTLQVQVRNSSNAVLSTLATYSNLNSAGGYSQKTFNLNAYKGQTIRIYFLGVEGSQIATSFLIDNVSLLTQ